MKVVVFGLGSVGQRHVRNLRAVVPHARVIAVRSRGAPLPPELRGEWLTVARDANEALASAPDAVIVSNPTSLHLSTALAAAHAGCPMLLEKPVSHSLEDVDALVAQARAPILVGFQFRYDPGLCLVHDIVRSGKLGRIVHTQANYAEHLPSWHPWEDYRASYSARRDLGGGALRTLCHAFDWVRWIVGDVKAVCAMSRTTGMLDLDVDDCSNVLMEHVGGATSSIHLDLLRSPTRQDIEVIGESGTVTWSAADSIVHLSLRGEDEVVTAPPLGHERNAMFLAQMRHFVDVVAGKCAPAVTLDDGIVALRIALCAEDSAHLQRRVNVTEGEKNS